MPALTNQAIFVPNGVPAGVLGVSAVAAGSTIYDPLQILEVILNGTPYSVVAGVPSVPGGPISPPLGGGGGTASGPAVVRSVARPPTTTDNAATGYPASAVWQFNGRAWTTDGTGIWTETVAGSTFAFSLPVDAFGASNIAGAWGLRPMLSGYAGNAMQFTSGGNTTSYPTSAAGLDESAPYRDIANANAGNKLITLTQLTDQSGNTNHLVPVGGWAPPNYGQIRLGGYSALSSGVLNGPCRLFASGTSVNSQNFVAMMVARPNCSGTQYGNFADIICEIGNAANSGNSIVAYFSKNGKLAINVSGGQNIDCSAGLRSDFSVITIIGTANGLTIMQDEEVVSYTGPLPAMTLTGFSLYGAAAFGTFTGGIGVLGAFLAKTAGNAQALSALRRYLYVYYNIMPQVREDVFVLGDSRSYGWQTVDGRNWPIVMATALGLQGRPVRIHNASESGLTTQQALSQPGPLASLIASVSSAASVYSTLYLALGTNSLSNIGNESVANTMADLINMASQGKAAGIKKVCVSAELPRGDNATYNASVTALRALILGQNNPIIDRVLDWQQIPALTVPSGALWAGDGLHPNTGGHSVMGNYAAAQHLAFG